jgi:hypothetical protein
MLPMLGSKPVGIFDYLVDTPQADVAVVPEKYPVLRHVGKLFNHYGMRSLPFRVVHNPHPVLSYHPTCQHVTMLILALNPLIIVLATLEPI